MSTDSLQPSIVFKEYKRVLGDNYKISKDAKESIVLSSNIFIHYITTLALDIAQKEKKSTLQPKHIMEAIELAGFGEMLPDLESLLNELADTSNQKKDDTIDSE